MKKKQATTTNNSLALVLLAIVSFLLIAALGSASYFLITQSFEITTLTDKKANQSDVYNRENVDHKIPSGGIQGPKGAKGDPGSVGITLLMTNDYAYDNFAKLDDEMPIVLIFPSNFKLTDYANKVFVGWIVASHNRDKLLSGELYDLITHKILGYYNLTSQPQSIVGSITKIKWIFQKMINLPLFTNYPGKAELTRELATKILKSNAYTKEDVDRLAAQKIAIADVYDRTTLDTKLKALPGLKDHYSKSQLEIKLATKLDKTASATKGVVDGELLTKEDKITVYDKTDFNNLLANKYDKNLLYSKTDADNKLDPVFFNAHSVVKKGTDAAGKITSTTYSSFLQNYPVQARFQKWTNEVAVENLKLFKGDRLIVEGKVRKTHLNHQGPAFIFADQKGTALKLWEIKHWNRWMGNAKVNMEQSHVYGPLDLNDHPLFIAHNLLFDYYHFKLDIFFGDDYVYVQGHGVLDNQSDSNDTFSIAILSYPSGFTNTSWVTLDYVDNFQVDYSSAKRSSAASTATSDFGTGSEIKFTFDLVSDQHKNLKTPKKELVIPFG